MKVIMCVCVCVGGEKWTTLHCEKTTLNVEQRQHAYHTLFRLKRHEFVICYTFGMLSIEYLSLC